MKFQLITILLISLLFGCSESQKKEEVKNTKAASEQGNPKTKLLSKVQLTDLEGNPIDLKSFRGKTVFLNFWATWCRPCVNEIPSIEKANKILENDDFVFLLASDEKLSKIKKFTEKNPFKLQFVKLKSSTMDLGIDAIPTTWIINKKGEVVSSEIGAAPWDSDKEIAYLKEMAAK